MPAYLEKLNPGQRRAVNTASGGRIRFQVRRCSSSRLKPTGRGLTVVTVVGDDAQAIYSFRAATVRNILDFPGQLSPPGKIVTLDRN